MERDLAGWMFLTLPGPGPNKQSALGQEKQIPVGTTNKLLDWTALSNHSPNPWALPGTCLQHQIPRHQGGLEPCAQYSVPEDAQAQGRLSGMILAGNGPGQGHQGHQLEVRQ